MFSEEEVEKEVDSAENPNIFFRIIMISVSSDNISDGINKKNVNDNNNKSIQQKNLTSTSTSSTSTSTSRIQNILSSIDHCVASERNTTEEVRTLDLEILQIVSLISLIEGNKVGK